MKSFSSVKVSNNSQKFVFSRTHSCDSTVKVTPPSSQININRSHDSFCAAQKEPDIIPFSIRIKIASKSPLDFEQYQYESCCQTVAQSNYNQPLYIETNQRKTDMDLFNHDWMLKALPTILLMRNYCIEETCLKQNATIFLSPSIHPPEPSQCLQKIST